MKGKQSMYDSKKFLVKYCLVISAGVAVGYILGLITYTRIFEAIA